MIFTYALNSLERLSYLKAIVSHYLPNFSTLALLTFKLKTVADRSCCTTGPTAWNSLRQFLRAGALACTAATTVAVSWPLTLMASNLIPLGVLLLLL